MFQLLCVFITTSQILPTLSLDVVRTNYVTNYDILIQSLCNNVYIQEYSVNDGRSSTTVFASQGEYAYSIDGYQPGEIRWGQFLTSKTCMQVGYNQQAKKSHLLSYVNVNPKSYELIHHKMRPMGMKYLYEIPFHADSHVKDILEGASVGAADRTTRAACAEERIINKERIVRLHLYLKDYRYRNSACFFFGITPMHGYFDLAPGRSWVIVSASMMGGRTWTNEFEGTIHGVPRLKKVTDRFKSADGTTPDRIITREIIQYDPMTTIDTTMFEPKFFGIGSPLDHIPASLPTYMIIGVLVVIVTLAMGGFRYRQRNKKAVAKTLT